MARSNAKTVDEYLKELPTERRQVVSAVRNFVLKHLPEGYHETMNFGMISYEIPLERYPKTYNKQPLAYAALAAQKNYYTLYLMSGYGPERKKLDDAYRAAGKKLDMGKSCLHFKRVEELPLDVIGEVIAGVSVDEHIARFEAARKH